MEQILVSQLSSLAQTSFQLTLRGNSKKISQFRRELSEYLTSNSVAVDIVEKEDNLLTGDKVQVVSQTTYSNYSRTVENIFTGSFNPIIFDYVLNHCKQKTLMGFNNSLTEGTFKFKIGPLIKIQSILSKNKTNNRMNKLCRQEQSEQMMAPTQRNSNKSNRNVKISRKNEEDHSKQSVNHGYHGRKCYCCSNRSDEGSQLLDQFSIFTRIPKKSFDNNKQNSGKKPLRVSEFHSIKKSPQSLTHQLSMRGNSSQSDRNSKSPSIYFRKHLQTIVNKKEGENSNRCSKIVGEGDNKVEKSDTISRSESNKWIKTKRNEETLGKMCQIDDQKTAQLKKASKLSTKITRNNNKVFQKTLQSKVIQNKAQFSDDQSIKDHSSDCKKVSRHQTANNTAGITKIQIEQRYSQMIAPNSPTIQIMGGYSVDQKTNQSSNICPGLQKMAHQRNQSTESLCKNKKQLDPIAKIKRKNEAKMRNNQDTPIILNNKSNQKIVSANKTFHERESVINVGRSPLNKSNENNASTHRLSANRIKKLPLTQKMQMIKHGQQKTKTNKRQESQQPKQMHQKDEIKDNTEQNERTKMHIKEETIISNHNYKLKSQNSLKKVQQSRKKLTKSPNNSISKAVSGEKKVSNNIKPRQVIQNQQKDHEDDNFSVTQQRINNYQQHQQMSTPIHNKEKSSDPKPENDLACTIKQITYEDEQFKNKQMRQSHPMSIEGDNSSSIQTSRTIPLRNQTNETVKSAKQELQIYKHNNDRQGEVQSNDFVDKSQKPQNFQRSSADILSNNRYNTCESQQIIQSKVNNHQNIEFNHNMPQITTESDFLNESLIKADQQCSGSNNIQHQPSEYSSTKKLQIKQEYEKNNRFSIDEQLHSARSAHQFNQNRVSENATGDKIKIQSDKNVLSGNLQQFEKELFVQLPKSESKDHNQSIQNVKINKAGRKDLLRLQTIDEVNESIYRQNQKKQMEQKLNSLSVSSNVSNCKLKNNVSNASSNIVTETAINSKSNQLKNEQNTQRKNEVKVSQESNVQYECESKQIICSQKSVQQHNYQPIYTPYQNNQDKQQQIIEVSNQKKLKQPLQQGSKLQQISNDKNQIDQNLIKKSKGDIEKQNLYSDVHKNERNCNVVQVYPQNTQLHEKNTTSIQNLQNKGQANFKQEAPKPLKQQEKQIQTKFNVSPAQEQPLIYLKNGEIDQVQLKEASSKLNGSKVDRCKASIPEEQSLKIIETIQQSNKNLFQDKKQTVENRQNKQVANEETVEINKKEQIMKQQQSSQSPKQNLNKQIIAPTSLIMPNIIDNSKIHSDTVTKEKFEQIKVSSVAQQPNQYNLNERSSMKKITMTVPQKDTIPQNMGKKLSNFQNKIDNMASKFHQQHLQQQYPSKSSNTVHLAPRQQKNIQVQTDYLLPNQQPLSTQKSLISKSQSDHLSKKKCKINLCEPQIISTFNNFTSSHQIITKQLKKKKRQSTQNQINYKYEDKRLQKDALIVNNTQQESQNLKNNPILATQPSNQINNLRPDNNKETGKNSVFSNMFDLSHNQQTKTFMNEHLNIQQQQKREDFNLKLQFRPSQSQQQTINHPQIINKLVYKNIPIVRADVTERQYSEKKGEIVANAIAFIQRTLPNFIDLISNKQKTEICLFVNNQWMLFRNSSTISLSYLLCSQLREQSIYRCIEMMTGMPMRILKDKSQQNSKRLIKSLKTMLEKRQEESSFQRILYGLSKMTQQVVCLQKVRYFLDNSKQSKSILECRKAAARKAQQLCNFEGEAVNEFIQLFLISNPKYLTLEVDPASVNTYEIELAQVVFYVSGNYKFILYEQAAKNEYRLVKESHLWLKHKNQGQLTKFLLILEPVPKKQGQHVITLRLATAQGEQGSRTNRVVKYQCGGRAKGYQGGYQNQKNLYLPVSKEITQCPLD